MLKRLRECDRRIAAADRLLASIERDRQKRDREERLTRAYLQGRLQGDPVDYSLPDWNEDSLWEGIIADTLQGEESR